MSSCVINNRILCSSVTQGLKTYNKRVIVSGKVVEYYSYESDVICDKKPSRNVGLHEVTEEEKAQNRKKSAQRARVTVRRLVNSNMDLTKFVTLTFKECVTDLTQANKVFNLFIKRLKRVLKKPLKYLVVPEFQDKNGRGAVHYHMISNLDYIPNEKLRNIWGQGFVKINRIDNVDNVGAYVTKYMSKDSVDERLSGRKCYFCSRNLDKPVVFKQLETVENVMQDVVSDEKNIKRIRSFDFFSEHLGTVAYSQIILKTPINIEKHIKRLSFWYKVKKGLQRVGELPFIIPRKYTQLSFGGAL